MDALRWTGQVETLTADDSGCQMKINATHQSEASRQLLALATET